MYAKRVNAALAVALGCVLAGTMAVQAQVTHTWETGSPEVGGDWTTVGDVTTFASGIQISSSDLIQGLVPLRIAELAAGWPLSTNNFVPPDGLGVCTPSPINSPNPGNLGFHAATPDKSGARLTDGQMGAHVDSVLADFLSPAGVFQFNLPAASDIGEIRVFAQNVDPNAAGNGRVFQNYDVYISRDSNPDAKNRLFTRLVDRVITSNIVCWPDGMHPNVNDTQAHNFPDGRIGATLTRVFDASSPRLASGVTSIRFVFWPVSNTGGMFLDRWLGKGGCVELDPRNVDPLDGDGFHRPFEAPIIKEIDVLPPAGSFEICDNGIDDTGNTLIDCADPQCAREPACTTREICNNGADDNGNGLIDEADPDCAPTPSPCPPEICDDEIDNDGNSLTDCDDPDCWDDPVCRTEICDDGIDNNGNDLIDCDDPDCFDDPVCLCPNPVFDTNKDGVVDMLDFGIFQRCFTGDGDPEGSFSSLSQACKCMDISGPEGQPDQAISAADFNVFLGCWTGPAMPGLLDPACDNPPF